jgi:hypothetical protein
MQSYSIIILSKIRKRSTVDDENDTVFDSVSKSLKLFSTPTGVYVINNLPTPLPTFLYECFTPFSNFENK